MGFAVVETATIIRLPLLENSVITQRWARSSHNTMGSPKPLYELMLPMAFTKLSK